MVSLFLLSTPLLSQVGASPTYQVISQDPHHVALFRPYIQTIKQNGRQWLVKLAPQMPLQMLKYFHLVDLKNLQLDPNLKIKPLGLARKHIVQFLDQIEPEKIKQQVIKFSTFNSRAAGSEGNLVAAKLIQDQFKQMGYDVSQTCYAASRCSIIAEKIGKILPKEIILVMAHFDSVGHPFAGSDDNGSGTAVLLEMAEVLKSYDNHKTIRFFATNGEELGLLGAKYYARQLQSSGEISQISLAINMDMVGYNSNGIVELETNKPFEKLALRFVELAQKYTTLKTKITLGAWGSDHVPFLDNNVATILTIEDWSTKTPCYHKACDKPETVNYQYAAEIGKLNIAAVMEQDVSKK